MTPRPLYLVLLCHVISHAQRINIRTLQNSDCEQTTSDGRVIYYACLGEPMHLLRSGNSNFNVTVEPSGITCGSSPETFCTLVGISLIPSRFRTSALATFTLFLLACVPFRCIYTIIMYTSKHATTSEYGLCQGFFRSPRQRYLFSCNIWQNVIDMAMAIHFIIFMCINLSTLSPLLAHIVGRTLPSSTVLSP